MSMPLPPALHRFHTLPAEYEKPAAFTYPFDYVPHPLAAWAVQELSQYVLVHSQLGDELAQGKMLGVLVVELPDKEVGYLAAYSGNLLWEDREGYFVPPVFDYLHLDSYFKHEEAHISALNARIEEGEQSETLQHLREEMVAIERKADEALRLLRRQNEEAKQVREQRRGTEGKEIEAELIRESQYQKAELKRAKRYWQEQIAERQSALMTYLAPIQALREERKVRSVALQKRLFHDFQMLNSRGERRSLTEIFKETALKTPPSGAGECALPKLLQYAFLNGWKPLCMGEFWWGKSPRETVREHGVFYPSCMGKCQPILQYMLKGMEIEKPYHHEGVSTFTIEKIWEDDWLIAINKPAGVLSVRGNSGEYSLEDWFTEQYPALPCSVVHRLDRDTSGIMLIAKQAEAYQQMQTLFAERKVQKRYVAIVEGTVETEKGSIALALSPDYLDRPRQRIDEQHGKPALTQYHVVQRTDAHTLLNLFPQTGRTHQLRVHCAHERGLHAPIVGDRLYGSNAPAPRMYLHAETLSFLHPMTGEKIVLTVPSDFTLPL